MAKIQLLFLVTLLCSAVLATPIHQKQKRSFKIPRLQQTNYVPNGPAALRRALFKFGFDDIRFVPNGEVATRIKASSEAALNETDTENGDVPAAPTQNDAQFLSPVSVGGQTLVMNFDSGSSDMWVFNTNLQAQSQSGHTIYDPSKSSNSGTVQGATFNISYGDGSFASGPVGFDTVDIGGATVDKQAIGLPDTVADSFVTDSASNGLVGLAFSKLNTIKPNAQKTFFDNVMPDLSQPVFTASLKHGQAGSYEFGNIDQSLFTGQLSTAAVDSSQGFWMVDSASAAVNGQTINIANGQAIMDTGTSLMLVSDDLLAGYWGQVEGAQLSQAVGGVIFPCDAGLPDLQVAIGSNMATVSGQALNFAQAGTDRATGTQFCFGGIQSNQGLGFSIYGDTFFKSQFVVFDGSGPSISVAPHS